MDVGLISNPGRRCGTCQQGRKVATVSNWTFLRKERFPLDDLDLGHLSDIAFHPYFLPSERVVTLIRNIYEVESGIKSSSQRANPPPPSLFWDVGYTLSAQLRNQIASSSQRCKSVPRISHLDTSSSQSGFPPTCFQRWPRHLQWWPSYFPPAVSSRMPHLVTFHTFDLALLAPGNLTLSLLFSQHNLGIVPSTFQCPSPFLGTKYLVVG